ncbi:unnamed protein product, partial [marine sediment metagenome]
LTYMAYLQYQKWHNERTSGELYSRYVFLI